MPSVFLSHNSEDRAFVQRLASDLRSNGIEVWYDKWEIKVGDSIVSKINQAISSQDYLGVILTPRSVKSKWVQVELNAALMKELAQKSVFILPILAAPCQIPPLITDKRYADFTKDYYLGLSDLLTVLFPARSGLTAISPEPIIDANAHLWMRSFDNDLKEVITRAKLCGVDTIVAAGCSGPLAWAKSLDLARRHDFIYISLALHPYDVKSRASDLQQLKRLVDYSKVVCLGDIQLNYKRNIDVTIQREIFDNHCKIATKASLPMLVEVCNSSDDGLPDAEIDFWQVLQKYPKLAVPIIIQLYGRPPFIEECEHRGFYFLVAGNITFPKAESERSCLKKIPLNRIVLGSDAPMLAPVPMRGRRNEPSFLPHLLKTIASVKGCTEQDVARATTKTARSLFDFARTPKSIMEGITPPYLG